MYARYGASSSLISRPALVRRLLEATYPSHTITVEQSSKPGTKAKDASVASMSAVAGQAGVNEVTNMTVTLLHSSAADDNEAEEHSIASSRLGGGVAALGALGASGGGDAAAEVALTATVRAGAVIVPERACVSSAERACNDAGSIHRGTCDCPPHIVFH
jgi:hypothetical protein